MTGDLLGGRRAVVFDFFGTLTPVSPPEAWASNAASLAAAIGAPAAALSQALGDTFGERITGSLGDVRQTVQALADRIGVSLDDDRLDAAAEVRRELQESMFALRPETPDVLARLRARGLRVGLVSDCSSELPDAWPRLPVAELIDAPVFSCRERTRKPDPRLFLTAAARLGAEPGECLYVGDGGGDELAGACAVGMRAVLLAGADWHRSHSLEHWQAETGWTGPRISSLTDLLGE